MKRTALFGIGLAGVLALTTLSTAQMAGRGRNAPDGPRNGPGMCQAGPAGQGRMCRPGRGDGMMIFHRLRGLDLTSEQWDQIREIRTNTEKQVIRKRADLQVLRIEKRELMHSDSPSASDVESIIRRMGDIRTEIQILHANAALQVRGVLTEEQREKLLDPSWRPDPPPVLRDRPRMRVNQN